MTCIYNWAKQVPLVIAFDGWSAYPKAYLTSVRDKSFELREIESKGRFSGLVRIGN